MELTEKQKKWDLLEMFVYAYISQPPDLIWNDENARAERDEMHRMLGWDVFQTDFRAILREYPHTRLITLAVMDAKEFYEENIKGGNTDAYNALKPYAERVAKQRHDIRCPPPEPKPIVKFLKRKKK
jgi:hypothetical protein